jgi:allophanate hydrolase
MLQNLPFDLPSLHESYAKGTTAQQVVEESLRRIAQVNDPGIFLYQLTDSELAQQIESLGEFNLSEKPLWGIPFVIKDNIDAEDIDTTAACPDYAYRPKQDAFVVTQLKNAGAILIGKTNLDQFATGLVGVRTPYPAPKNAIDPEIVPGGSSSGSATAVAHGLVCFSLGTDTAGSGRVPAALNSIVGLKPTLGALSLAGVVPACKTLDTVSIFALNVEDAYQVFSIVSQFDSSDAFSKHIPAKTLQPAPSTFKVGIPSKQSIRFFDDAIQSASFDDSIKLLTQLGAEIIEIDFTLLYQIADLLYQGAWVAERYTVIEDLLNSRPDSIHPTTLKVIKRAENISSADVFRDLYHLEDLKAQVSPLLQGMDMLCVPSIPTFYSVSDLQADPIEPNSRFGTYTNFVNLLDLCGIAVPVNKRSDGRPGSVTLLATAGKDAEIASIAIQLQRNSNATVGATDWALPEQTELLPSLNDGEMILAAVGAHMSGLPLNWQLTERGARLLRADKTADQYKLYSLPGGPPFRPGLIQDVSGSSIDLELWILPESQFGSFIQSVPKPLVIGTITLSNGEQVKSFLCESIGLDGAQDITHFGGWRAFLESKS